METQAATPTGAETSARPDASATPSVHDRLKTFLGSSEPEPKPEQVESPVPGEKPEASAKAEEPEQVEEPEPEKYEPSKDAQDEEEQAPQTLDELAEALGWDLDKILDLEAKTKIDGKEGKLRLRDLVKSHQLEGHLNQKLMAQADERKSFELERQNFGRERAEKLVRMDAGLKTLERALTAEYAGIDWQALQAQNPEEFNAKFVGYQQRYAQLQDIANQIGAEQQQHQAETAAKDAAYLAEQRALMAAKIPEWADETRRTKDRAEIAEYMKGYGFEPKELDSIKDHRQALVIRDAWQWHKLQKAKPAIINKVKTAPKLLKPGTTQSRAAQDSLVAKSERDRLRQSGKVRDAVPGLKRFLFK